MHEESAAETSDREIVTTRVFDAPRALVFEAWSRPEHLARWWGPRGFTITTHEHDFRPGGVWRLTMHGPDGTDYANRHVFEEIVPNERIVHRHNAGHDGGHVASRFTVTFADEGEKTRVTMRMVFASAAERDAVDEKYHAVEGAKQTLARLGEHVEAMARRPPDLVLTRTFAAPRRLVFEAWTKAEHVARWFTPRPLVTSACEIDFRPGGVFRVVMRMPSGLEHPFEGRFGEIVAPERLVFTGKIHGEIDVETTVTFADEGERTTLSVRQTYSRASDATRGAPEGWRATLDQLGEHVAEASRG
jgi:uncharacterized protein YndB with AHSA1/START domain